MPTNEKIFLFFPFIGKLKQTIVLNTVHSSIEGQACLKAAKMTSALLNFFMKVLLLTYLSNI